MCRDNFKKRKGREKVTHSEKVSWLIQQFVKENPGYAVVKEPVNEKEKRRLLRSLMNVRWPGEADETLLKIQDELLQEELRERGIIYIEEMPFVAENYPCSMVKNADRISLWQGDITRLAVDAIVNAANGQLLGCFVPCHGCIDNVIHSAAGIQLRNECAKIMEEEGHDVPAGKAKITSAYNLPSKYVIHTVGPIVGIKVTKRQEEELASCYLNCLRIAEKNQLESIAFCCISTGEFHFPNKLAAQIALETVDRYLSGSKLKRVIFNVFKDEDLNIYQKLFR